MSLFNALLDQDEAVITQSIAQTKTPVIVVDSITTVPAVSTRPVIVTGSHGGLIAAQFAILHHPSGVIFNDAGVGLDRAGISGLVLLNSLGIPAATVGHNTARIGDSADMMNRGLLSHCNERASQIGLRSGLPCQQAAKIMATAKTPERLDLPPPEEARRRVAKGPLEIWLVDSASLVQPSDAGHIIITGSHGGLVGGDPNKAIKAHVRFAVFNDAGIGIDKAGIGRLHALEAQGIAAATISAQSARIGDALSTWNTGVISACNEIAMAHGVTIGLTTVESVDRMRLITDTERST